MLAHPVSLARAAIDEVRAAVPAPKRIVSIDDLPMARAAFEALGWVLARLMRERTKSAGLLLHARELRRVGASARGRTTCSALPGLYHYSGEQEPGYAVLWARMKSYTSTMTRSRSTSSVTSCEESGRASRRLSVDPMFSRTNGPLALSTTWSASP